MIDRDHVMEWREHAPWADDSLVEHDLIISRALVEMFSNKKVRESFAFRGGTALNKFYVDPPARYSEDIDLVQLRAEPIGPSVKAMRDVLDPWLGEPKSRQNHGRFKLFYRFQSEDVPPIPLRLKVEINTREHFAHYGFVEKPFAVKSSWFEGETTITTYELDEMMATKMRALYQRRKGRDLFDLDLVLQQLDLDPERVVEAFLRYTSEDGINITRAQMENSLAEKVKMPSYADDIPDLLMPGKNWDVERAAENVLSKLVALLPGEPRKESVRDADVDDPTPQP